ncbi:MAG: type VI secretion system Vgr family protein [Telluria sp.]
MNSPFDALIELFEQRQNKRSLRIAFPNGDGPAALLLPHKLHAEEALSIDYAYKVELIAEDARIPLKNMQGKMVTVSLVRGDGSLRHFNGYVVEFRLVKTDDALAFYEMLLQPWLAYLKQRKNNRLFHGLTLREQTESIFKQYGAYAVWDGQLQDEDPEMTMACQFDESDHNYLHRHPSLFASTASTSKVQYRRSKHTNIQARMASPMRQAGDVRRRCE